MKILPLILILAFVGCKSVKPYVANASGEAVAKSSAFIAAASANIDAAKSDSGNTGKILLTVANSQLNNASKENDVGSNQIHATQRELADANQDASTWQAAWRQERSHFFSHIQRTAWYWIVGVGLASWVALGLIGAFLPFGGIGSTIMRVLPFANPFAWLRDRIIAPGTLRKTKRL